MGGYQLKPADLIIVRGDGPVDKVIEAVSHSPYSHVAGVVRANEVFEAQALRTDGYNGLDFYRGYSDIYTCDALTDEQRQNIVLRVLANAGRHYGYKLILWEAEHYLLHWDPDYNDDEDPDCSQLWGNAYRAEGFDPCPGLPVMSPGDLATSPTFRYVGPYE